MTLPSYVPSGWKRTTLGELCSQAGGAVQTGPFGSQLHAADYVMAGIPSVMPVDIADRRVRGEKAKRVREADAERLARYRLRAGDIVFSRRGDVGSHALVTSSEDGWLCGTGCLFARLSDESVLSEYVSYWLSQTEIRQWILGHAVGTTMPNLNAQIVAAIPIAVPSIATQREISTTLSSLDDKIELNRRTSRTLEAMAQVLFRSWFVDFDPVVAKADGREPFGMEADIAALFPDQLVDSELGPIPEGWEIASIPERFDVNPARRLRKGADAPYLEMANLPENAAIPEHWVTRPFGSGTRFMNGDTVVARITPCLENGKTGFVNFLREGEVGWGSTEYVVLRPKEPFPTEFAYFLARTPEFRSFAIAELTGSSGRQRVPTSAWSHLRFAFPPPTLAKRWGETATPVMRKLRRLVEESRTLGELRDLLLPRLLSGEFRLAEVDDAVSIPA